MSLISIITPLYNEEGNLPQFKSRLEKVFSNLPHDYEVLLIDNCSRDGSQEWCIATAQQDPRWRYLRFSRNFNSETSIAAGYHYARGDAAIILFSDLQDPPELIPQFIKKWQEGYDVVSGIVKNRNDSNWLYYVCSKLIYQILYMFTNPKITKNATDFKLLDRAVINALKETTERVRYSRGLINWLGYDNYFLEYNRQPRKWGRSYANVWYRISFAIGAITSFSGQPLRLIFLAGVVLMFCSSMLLSWYVINYLSGSPIPGNTTIYTLLLGGLAWQGITIGLLGEYVSGILLETKNRPRWVISDCCNLGATAPNTVRRKARLRESDLKNTDYSHQSIAGLAEPTKNIETS